MPTTNILTRISMVESQYFRGTIFSLDVDHREYWITAKHILTGAEHPPYGSVSSRSVSLRILDPGAQGERWLPVNFSVIDTGNDIELVVLAPPEPLLKNPLPSLSSGSQGCSWVAIASFLVSHMGAEGGQTLTMGNRSGCRS
jgi:hypothetical protein